MHRRGNIEWHRTLLIGGPVHGRREALSKEQVERGYEFVDPSGGYGPNVSNDGPHSHWRSGKYVKFGVVGDTIIMVHDSVIGPEAWKAAERLAHAKANLRRKDDEIKLAEESVKWAEVERDALAKKLEKTQRFNTMAKQLLEEALDA